METPDRVIGQQIVEEFKSKSLLSEAKLARLAQTLPAGELSSDDWKLLFETDRPPEQDAPTV